MLPENNSGQDGISGMGFLANMPEILTSSALVEVMLKIFDDHHCRVWKFRIHRKIIHGSKRIQQIVHQRCFPFCPDSVWKFSHDSGVKGAGYNFHVNISPRATPSLQVHTFRPVLTAASWNYFPPISLSSGSMFDLTDMAHALGWQFPFCQLWYIWGCLWR